jgi:cytochrome c oxidase subunit 2
MLAMVHKFLGEVLGATASGSFWFPVQASSSAPKVDWIYDVILWISTFFFVLIVAIMAYFVMRYKRKQGVSHDSTASHSTALEVAWTVLPSFLLLAIFYLGVTTYIEMRNPPRNGVEIQVVAQKWNWQFVYPGGVVSPELHVPVDEDVRLVMRSEDVLHSFYVPAFRVKMDVVPGRYTNTWFQATKQGEYPVFCTEYCGTNHSAMLSKVVVHEPGGYETWLAKAGDVSNRDPVELGKELVSARGCMQCHSVDGSRKIGPSFKGIFGKQEALVGGGKVLVDENYIVESINNPQAKVVDTYAPVMPPYQGKFKDAEISGIVAYIKSLKD